MNIPAIPPLHDHHSHPLFYASLRSAVNLESIDDKAVALEQLQHAAAQIKTGQILLAFGWRSNQFTWRSEELESLPAAAIFNLSLHQLVVNQAGQTFLQNRFGEDVDRITDIDWYERNLRTVLNWFAGLNATTDNLQSFFDDLLQLGIESAEEMLLVNEAEIELFEAAGLTHRTRFWAAPSTYDVLTHESQQKTHGLKLFTDGALGAGTAALNASYLNEPSNHGMLVYSDAVLTDTICDCLQRSPNLAIHAIGDRAIDQTLQSLKIASRDFSLGGVRIEHAQMLSRDNAALAKDFGVTLSMQPNFNSDSLHYADRLSPNYLQMNNPFRMLIDDLGFEPGRDLVFGSDGMPHGIEAAIRDGISNALPHQKLTLDELIAGYRWDHSPNVH